MHIYDMPYMHFNKTIIFNFDNIVDGDGNNSTSAATINNSSPPWLLYNLDR